MTTVNAIVITRSLRGGHYRAGRHHAPEPTEWVPGTLTTEQLEAMQADPDLEVKMLEAAPAPEPEPGPDAAPEPQPAPETKPKGKAKD